MPNSDSLSSNEIIAASAEHPGPIGVFDSGYGGLTVLRSLQQALPEADFIYLGDNARAPYGNRSFDLIYHFTRQAVEYLFAFVGINKLYKLVHVISINPCSCYFCCSRSLKLVTKCITL